MNRSLFLMPASTSSIQALAILPVATKEDLCGFPMDGQKILSHVISVGGFFPIDFSILALRRSPMSKGFITVFPHLFEVVLIKFSLFSFASLHNAQ